MEEEEAEAFPFLVKKKPTSDFTFNVYVWTEGLQMWIMVNEMIWDGVPFYLCGRVCGVDAMLP